MSPTAVSTLSRRRATEAASVMSAAKACSVPSFARSLAAAASSSS